MKRKTKVAGMALLLACSISFQSCIGSFSLTNKVLTWNRQVSNKFVNELVFFAFWVLPVYEVTMAADLLVINSIEFWSGNKPLEANNQVIDSENGQYFIAVNETGYDIIGPDGKHIQFIYDKDSNLWSFSSENFEKIDFLKFEDENTIKILDKTGEFIDVELTQEGVGRYINQMLLPTVAIN